jgi:hypothetical protein
MGLALAGCGTPWICFADADIEESSRNIPLALREALEDEPADMIVGDFEWRGRRFRHSMDTLYTPLVRALFPEADGRFGDIPYSGFRLLRTARPWAPLPPGYGVESYLNVVAASRGWSTRCIHLGEYAGPIRKKPVLGWEVGQSVLDVAQADGRIDAALRTEWDAWHAEVMEVLSTQPDPNEAQGEWAERLAAVRARPLPGTVRA